MWIRTLDSLTSVSIKGTEGATDPFWSPDSRSIGFFAQGKMKKVAADLGSSHHQFKRWPMPPIRAVLRGAKME